MSASYFKDIEVVCPDEVLDLWIVAQGEHGTLAIAAYDDFKHGLTSMQTV